MAERTDTKRRTTITRRNKQSVLGETIETEWINFVLRKMKPKTQTWMLFTKERYGEAQALGIIEWYAPWRHYCFFPFPETVWSDRCLTTVRDFVKELNDNHGK